LTNKYLSGFCMEMHMLLQAGISLNESVQMIHDDEPDKDGKALLKCMLSELEQGVQLSSALRKAVCFPHYLTSMVEAGEKTGRLVDTLKALSEYYERQERQVTAIKNAVLYPTILLVMMVAVVLILITRVLPVYNDVFSRLGARMSPLSNRLMQFGEWLCGASAVIAVVFGAIFVVAMIIWLNPNIHERVVRTFKNIWGSRGIFGSLASSHFVSAMTLSIATGLDTEEAVAMAAAVSGGAKAIDEKNAVCLDMIHSGKTLAEAMQSAGILSARDGRLLSIGARSGMADKAMVEIASRKERDVQDEIDRVICRIEPTLVIITSIIIGVILLSVMLPLIGIMTFIE